MVQALRQPSHTFSNVTASLPAKVRGSEAEEEWQEVDWVQWTTGELNVDGESLLLVFKPETKGAAVKPKPLGVLIRASAVVTDRDGRTLAIATSDSLHNLYRLTFTSAADCQTFADLAELAESRFVSTPDATSGAGANTASAVQAALLESSIKGAFADKCPLVQTGVELYGPDPRNAEGGEVLLGRGAAVLLDPVGIKIPAGAYELFFVDEDEGVKRPIHLDIGPKMQVRAQKPEDEDEGGPAAMLLLCSPTETSYTLAFDTASSAGDFERDLRLRMRCLRLLAGKGGARDLSSRGRGSSGRCSRFLLFLLSILMVAAVARLVLLMRAEPGRPPRVYVDALVTDARGSLSSLQDAGSMACAAFTGAVPRAELRACTALDRPSAWRCVESLANGGA